MLHGRGIRDPMVSRTPLDLYILEVVGKDGGEKELLDTGFLFQY